MLFEPASLLDEAHKGSDSSSRANHNDWVGGFEGQTKLRLADVHRNGGFVAIVSDQFILQPVCGHSFVSASSVGLVLHHHCTDVDTVGVNLEQKRVILSSTKCFKGSLEKIKNKNLQQGFPSQMSPNIFLFEKKTAFQTDYKLIY